MGWLTQKAFDKKKSAALELTIDQRRNLTWEEARQFVPADTLCIARFNGFEKRNWITPWNAVCIINNIENGDPDETPDQTTAQENPPAADQAEA